MTQHLPSRARTAPGERGLTLVELIICITILSILAGAAFPSPDSPTSASPSANCTATSG